MTRIIWNYERIKNFVLENECLLVTDEETFNDFKKTFKYASKIPLKYKCKCGKEFSTPFQNFIRINNPRRSCDICYGENRGRWCMSNTICYLDEDIIGEIRLKLKLSQGQISEILGISQSMMSLVEKGNRKLRITDGMKENIKKHLNITLEDLINKRFDKIKLNKNFNKDCFLYFIQESGGNHIKIGIATNIKSRICSIQTSNPFKINVLKIIDGDRKLESELHKKFKNIRIKGSEWFKPNDELIKFIDSLPLKEQYIEQAK